MIQRIQSVYLLLGAVAIFMMLFLDGTWETRVSQILSWYLPVVFTMGAVVVIAAVGAIFSYRDRARQLKAVLTLQVLTLIFMILLYGGFYVAGEVDLIRERGVTPATLALLCLPVVAYVFFYLARRGIQKDIDLVRSMDRLR